MVSLIRKTSVLSDIFRYLYFFHLDVNKKHINVFKMQLIAIREITFKNGQKKHKHSNTILPSDRVEDRM